MGLCPAVSLGSVLWEKALGRIFSYGKVLIILIFGNDPYLSLGHLGGMRSIKLLSY